MNFVWFVVGAVVGAMPGILTTSLCVVSKGERHERND